MDLDADARCPGRAGRTSGAGGARRRRAGQAAGRCRALGPRRARHAVPGGPTDHGRTTRLAAPADRVEPRRADLGQPGRTRPHGAVLHDPRLLRGLRRLRGQQRVRACVPGRAARPVGGRRLGGLRRRGAASRRGGGGRWLENGHPREQRRRHDRAERARGRRAFRCLRLVVRRHRPSGTRGNHPRLRSALHRQPDRRPSRVPGPLRGAFPGESGRPDARLGPLVAGDRGRRGAVRPGRADAGRARLRPVSVASCVSSRGRGTASGVPTP